MASLIEIYLLDSWRGRCCYDLEDLLLDALEAEVELGELVIQLADLTQDLLPINKNRMK